MTNQNTNMILRPLAAFAITFFLALAGCAPSSQSSRASAPVNASANSAQPGTMSDAGWTIVLAAFSGPDANAQAVAAANTIRSRVDLPNIRPQQRGRGAAVVSGNYRSPSDAAAQRDHARARAVTVDGNTPFPSAFLAPPAGKPDPGATPQYHLSRAFVEFGNQARYTLQIAVYESKNPTEARAAAEKAAVQLRTDGEPAFYYHGPSRSMVTIGAFSAAEAGLDTGLPGPVLAEYQRRHPYNLMNGRQLLTPVAGQSNTAPQTSFLVEIPRE
jgi:hypothetical protein